MYEISLDHHTRPRGRVTACGLRKRELFHLDVDVNGFTSRTERKNEEIRHGRLVSCRQLTRASPGDYTGGVLRALAFSERVQNIAEQCSSFTNLIADPLFLSFRVGSTPSALTPFFQRYRHKNFLYDHNTHLHHHSPLDKVDEASSVYRGGSGGRPQRTTATPGSFTSCQNLTESSWSTCLKRLRIAGLDLNACIR